MTPMKRAALAWGASAVACLALAVAPDGRGAAPPADTLPLARIVALLGADEPEQREDAVRRLARRVDALPLLRRAAASPDPEVRRRASGLVRRLGELEVAQWIGRAKTLLAAGEVDLAAEILLEWGGRDAEKGFVLVLKSHLGGQLADAERAAGVLPIRGRVADWLGQVGRHKDLPDQKVSVYPKGVRGERIAFEAALAQGCMEPQRVSSSLVLSNAGLQATDERKGGFVTFSGVFVADGTFDTIQLAVSVVISSGAVLVRDNCSQTLIVAGGPVTIKGTCDRSVIRSAGAIKCGGATLSTLLAGDTVKIGPSPTIKSTVKEKHTDPLGKTRFFTLDRVGLFPEKGGTKVTAVTPRSAAAAAGLLAGDEVAEVNGAKTADAAALRHALLRAYAFEEPAVLKVVRGGKTLTVSLPVHGR